MRVLATLLNVGAAVGICRAVQQPLRVPQAAEQHSGPSIPSADPLAANAAGYTLLGHPLFPGHSVRVKETHFCDGTVRAYTGYIDVEARHLFFYFFESRRDPDADDVVFWTNGGPGGSSTTGLFMELGPCRMSDANVTERFDYSWNEYANMLFVDQPVGVGFSYADHGEHVSSTHEAAKDIAAFVAIFFHHFSKFQGRSFHMAGESYAGRYLPVFAATVYDQNARLAEAGLAPVNLASIMLGNGCTDFLSMTRSYYDIQCLSRREFDFPPVQSIAECVRMREHAPRCEQRIRASCMDTYDRIDCGAALTFCSDSTKSFFVDNGGYNPHDRDRPCKPYLGMSECYPAMKNIEAYLNDPSTRTLLGVDPVHNTFVSHNDSVQDAFERNADRHSFHAEQYIGALLERGVRALVYVGANDFVCNWIGNEHMTFNVEWGAQDAYRRAPFRAWAVDGEVAGKVRSGGGLTFTTILGAGHLAPYDQPLRSLEVARRWLEGEEF